MAAIALPTQDLFFRRAAILLLSALLLSIVSYLGFLIATVNVAIDRVGMERTADAERARIAPLETTYVARLGSIDAATAHAHGFKEVDHPTYLSENDLPRVFSMRTAP